MAITKVTANVLADNSVTQAKLADDAVGAAELASNAVVAASIVNNAVIADKIASGAVTSAKIANDAVSFEQVDAEFTTSSALSAAATVAVNFDAAQVFTLTPNQNTTLNVTNPKIGVTKTLILTGSGGSRTIAFQVGGSSGTFNRINGEYDDTSGKKNLIQITCVAATEFWYSISQIAT
jgi:hypothetical protein